MRRFWAAIDIFWNQNPITSWILVLCGFGFVIWATSYPQSPGVSIGLLATAAGIMSIRPKMHPAEKTAWLIMLVSFAVLELRAIRHGDEAAASLREVQNLKFQGIAEEIKTSIEASKTQYQSTLGHVNGVLKITREVAATSKNNLENVTGGDSYAYVWPSISIGNTAVSLNIHNFGKQALSITVTIYSGSSSFDKATGPVADSTLGALYIGPVAPGEGRTIPPPRGYITPQLGADGMSHYLIYINQQNTGVNEKLDFRPAAAGNGWAYRINALRPINGKHKKGDVFIEGHWIRYLKVTDWIEPAAEPKQPW